MAYGRLMWSKCPYTRFNKSYHYILTVIDVLRKHIWTVSQNQKWKEMAIAIAKIIRDDGRCPICKSIWEKNFTTQTYKYSWKKYNIHTIYNKSLFNVFHNESNRRTVAIMLKNDMWKQFTHNVNYKWIDLLLHLVSQYNAQKYRTIGMQSIDVTPTSINS